MEGYRNPTLNKNLGRESRSSGGGLARRSGGGALRAFHRAEIMFDAVLFERCVGGVAGAMAVASILLLEFWFLWGIVLGCFWA